MCAILVSMIDLAFRHTKKFAVALIGGTIIVLGFAFFVLPGPGFLFVIVGLAVLATEFAWAKGLLEKAKQKYELARQKVKNSSKQD